MIMQISISMKNKYPFKWIKGTATRLFPIQLLSIKLPFLATNYFRNPGFFKSSIEDNHYDLFWKQESDIQKFTNQLSIYAKKIKNDLNQTHADVETTLCLTKAFYFKVYMEMN